MTDTATPEQRAKRKRLRDDFEYWAKHCCKIRSKDQEIVPLVLNSVQKRFVDDIIRMEETVGYLRFVVLKARQQGLSTVISAWQYFRLSQRKASKGLVMAHEALATQTLFDMYQRIHENVPALMRPHTKYSSRTELVFDERDSALRVATAGGRGVARGETLTVAHLSEVAFWPTAFASANFNGLVKAVPKKPGTAVFLESTANGMTGIFHEMWLAAEDGSSGYWPFFSAWFESQEYRTPAPADFQRTPEEEELIKLYSHKGLVDNDQLFWRRQEIATNGLDLFKQEYPSCPEEAFLSTGRPVFNLDYIHERLRDPERKQPITLMSVEPVYDEKSGKELPLRILREDPRGELKVFYPVDPSQTYVIGADVGMGIKGQQKGGGRKDGDPSVAQILDSQKRQVAVWRGIVHPDVFAKILIALGYHYNSALVAPERNNHGLVTCIALRDADYPYLYTDLAEGTLEAGKETIKLGFLTNEASKPLIIDGLRASDRQREIEINDETTLKEMMTFVVTEAGKMEADGNMHDDCVMSLAIANYAHEGVWSPVAVTDEFYSDAI
jgi:hypothetical protein